MPWSQLAQVRISTGMLLRPPPSMHDNALQRMRDIHAERMLIKLCHSVFEAELQDVIPICHATIAGTRIIGRLTAGYVLSTHEPDGRSSTRK
jgi:hypothetical protein